MTGELKPGETNAAPYQAPVSDFLISEGKYNYVGFWQRVFATTIDMVLSTILLLPFMYLFFGESVPGIDQAKKPDNLYVVISTLLTAAIVLAFWMKKAATPGKMLINSTIIDAASGGKPSIKQWVIRYISYFIAMIPLFIGLLWVGWDSRKQGWHDKMANTLVVKNNPR